MKLYESIELSLRDGPFRHFYGGWKFDDLGDDGSKIYFELNSNSRINCLMSHWVHFLRIFVK